ncbi:MAG TPA: DEAD/DEAH box helicase, partial [Polyangiaceae bacterium]|nr:DEAD/DEAH box helicase [Polyangiaceae bacterium]
MADLLDVVRKACLPAIWSQGVKLARGNAVLADKTSAEERTFRVKAQGLAVAPTVTLYLKEQEWSCDCGGRFDPCAHVAAAVIASEQGLLTVEKDEGATSNGRAAEESAASGGEASAPAAASPKSAARARLEYRLLAKNRGLVLTRVVVHPDGREERITTLASDIARGRLPREITPTHDDLSIDRILNANRRESLALDRLAVVLRALSTAEHVRLDGKPIKASGELVYPQATLEDGPHGGYRLRLEKDPAVDEVVAMGVARLGDTLRPLGETQSTGYLLERLPLATVFPRERQAELVAHVLPELEAKLKVNVRTTRLPRVAKDVRPRIAFDLSHHGHTLSVLPTLVYGDPPLLRIDGDQAIALSDDVPIRRRDEERARLQELRDGLNLVTGRRIDLDGTEAVRFAAKLRDWQRQSGDVRNAAMFGDKPLVPRLVMNGDEFEVLFETEDGDGDGEATARKRADAASVLRAFRDGLDLVPLDGGGWAPLPAAWLAQHGHRVLDLLAARDKDKKLPTAALPDLGALCDVLNAPKPVSLSKLEPLLKDFTGLPHVELPADLNAELRTYQQFGVDWLSFLRSAGLGAVLADDMGLGKTLQTICVLKGRVLVVCPKSVVHNWAAEIARFRPGLRTTIYHGIRRELEEHADVTLTTYSVLRLDIERLAELDWDIIVLDEAQAIKNAESQTARAAFQLKGEFRVALSGTPVENRLEELWSLIHFVNPGLLGARSDFQERYATPIAAGNVEAGTRLRSKVRPFVLRRVKRDVLPELPPRTDAVLHVELDENERAVYDAVRAATHKELIERLSQGGSVMAALEALLRLRQAACHAGLVPGQTAERSSKVDRLLEALDEVSAEGHKALVFSQWTSLLDRVEPHLKEAGIAFTRLDGSTRDRASVVANFQSESGPPVMLVSLKAGGTGLNLTAADHVFLLDPWWNPAVEAQAIDRAHRIGQACQVFAYRLIA